MNRTEQYVNNPNYCLQCGEAILIKEGQNVYDVARKKFCNSSCAATYNGLRRIRVPKDRKPRKKRKANPEVNKRAYNKRSTFIDNLYGEHCYFCSNTTVRIMHRKDGKPHKRLPQMNWNELYDLRDNHREEYVRVCGICHAGIHWCMEHLEMSWDDIKSG